MRIALIIAFLGLAVLGELGCQESAPRGDALPTPTSPVLPKLEITGPYIELTKDGPMPKELTVPTGTAVTVINSDTTYGKTLLRFETFSTRWLVPNERDTITFDKPGTYEYHMYTYPQVPAKIIVTSP